LLSADRSREREWSPNDLRPRHRREEIRMLMTIATLLIILWLLGMVSAYTMQGFIHLLLVIAIVAVLVRVIQGRSPV
jgi:hypothetical protein